MVKVIQVGLLTSFLTSHQKTVIRVLDCTEPDFEVKNTKIYLFSTAMVKLKSLCRRYYYWINMILVEIPESDYAD